MKAPVPVRAPVKVPAPVRVQLPVQVPGKAGIRVPLYQPVEVLEPEPEPPPAAVPVPVHRRLVRAQRRTGGGGSEGGVGAGN